MQITKECPPIITLICDADKRNGLLRLHGADNMEILSPTVEDFIKMGMKASAFVTIDKGN